jgi:hypothetical protein
MGTKSLLHVSCEYHMQIYLCDMLSFMIDPDYLEAQPWKLKMKFLIKKQIIYKEWSSFKL